MPSLKALLSLIPLLGRSLNDAPIPLPIPEPTGPYAVSLYHEEIRDSRGRPDPWHPETFPIRRVMVTHLHPIPRANCIHYCQASYLPEHLAKLEDEVLARLSLPALWPRGNLARLKLTVCCGSNRMADPTPHPRVLLSPAWNTSRLMLQATAMELASRGWEVTLLDHPGESSFVEFLDGKIVYGERSGYGEKQVARALDVRMQDERMVLDRLGVKFVTDDGANELNSRVGMVGWGFGGAAAAASMLNDTRIVGGVSLDGALLGPVLNAGLGRPNVNQSFLLWGAEGHGSKGTREKEESWVKLLETMRRWSPEQWVRELSLTGGQQESFGDLAIIADLADLRRDETMLKALTIGNIMGSRAQEVVVSFLDAFFNMTLFGKASGLLKGRDTEFPEVGYVK